jgi:hypothetical protein
MPNKFYKAIHQPTEIFWQPVTEPEVITTPDGKRVVLRPGEHVKITDLSSGGVWMNEPGEFVRRYIGNLNNPGVDTEGLKVFRKHYPDAEIPK